MKTFPEQLSRHPKHFEASNTSACFLDSMEMMEFQHFTIKIKLSS
jgi:hypothetical protein